jgi:hypothetical protein
VIVHDYEIYDINIDGWRHAQHKGTEERIRRAKGRIIPGTAQDVSAAEIDSEGRHNPRRAG